MDVGKFEKAPHSMLFYYTLLPKYKAEMTTLYALLLHYYNDGEGYAWPNVDTLAMHYGKSDRTTSDHLEVLEEYGLLRVIQDGAKKLFVPIPPLEREELFAKYPEAQRELERREQKREAERKRSAVGMARLREKMRGQNEGPPMASDDIS